MYTDDIEFTEIITSTHLDRLKTLSYELREILCQALICMYELEAMGADEIVVREAITEGVYSYLRKADNYSGELH